MSNEAWEACRTKVRALRHDRIEGDVRRRAPYNVDKLDALARELWEQYGKASILEILTAHGVDDPALVRKAETDFYNHVVDAAYQEFGGERYE